MKQLAPVNRRQTGLTTSEYVVYPMVVVVLIGVVFGYYHNGRIEEAIAAAVAQGEEQKVILEEYFEEYGEMPQSEADLNFDSFIPSGIVTGIQYRPGVWGEPAADKLLNGTLNVRVDMTEFGARWEEIESGYLLVAKAQDDGTIKWDCINDSVTPPDYALGGRYLRDTCKKAESDEDEEGGDGDDMMEE